MKNKLVMLLAAGALVVGAQQAQAISIINIGADNSYVTVNKAANTVTFVDVDADASNGNADVSFASGDFLGLYGEKVTYANFSYDPIGVVNPLWTLVSGAASFDLGSITSFDEAGAGLVVTGTGTINLNGDSFAGNWSFSADSTGGGIFDFSSTTTSVPDGGATALLLGLGFLGLGAVARRK